MRSEEVFGVTEADFTEKGVVIAFTIQNEKESEETPTPYVTLPTGDVPLTEGPGGSETPYVTLPTGAVPLTEGPDEPGGSVKTGDESNLFTWAALMAGAAACGAVLILSLIHIYSGNALVQTRNLPRNRKDRRPKQKENRFRGVVGDDAAHVGDGQKCVDCDGQQRCYCVIYGAGDPPVGHPRYGADRCTRLKGFKSACGQKINTKQQEGRNPYHMHTEILPPSPHPSPFTALTSA